jgi:hypothetical protein
MTQSGNFWIHPRHGEGRRIHYTRVYPKVPELSR